MTAPVLRTRPTPATLLIRMGLRARCVVLRSLIRAAESDLRHMQADLERLPEQMTLHRHHIQAKRVLLAQLEAQT